MKNYAGEDHISLERHRIERKRSEIEALFKGDLGIDLSATRTSGPLMFREGAGHGDHPASNGVK